MKITIWHKLLSSLSQPLRQWEIFSYCRNPTIPVIITKKILCGGRYAYKGAEHFFS